MIRFNCPNDWIALSLFQAPDMNLKSQYPHPDPARTHIYYLLVVKEHKITIL